jgi:hypothetical protein
MTTIELEPKFSIAGMPGKCLRCTAKEKLGSYLRKLLGWKRNKELMTEYEVLLAFLNSPELRKLQNDTEKLLSEGDKVKVKVYAGCEKPKYYELEWIGDETKGIPQRIIIEASSK